MATVVALCACGSSRPATSAESLSPREVPNGLSLTYAIESYGGRVTSAALNRTVEVLKARMKKVGVKGAIQTRRDILILTLPRPEAEAARAVTGTGRLYFYDWEPNVIGPDGKPAPTEGTVTGDSTREGPGGATAGLPMYEAVLRAAKRLPELRENDTTWSSGCLPRQSAGCSFGSWYLLDTEHEKVLRGPEETQANLKGELKLQPGAVTKAVRVNPGTVLVQAHAVESANGKVVNKSPASWYVLRDDPVLTGADVTHPQQGYNEGSGGNGQPNVNFGFNSRGRMAFERLTKEIAHRGQEAQLPGVPKEAALQHFAVALDGQLITVPSIDYTQYPEGIDARNGSEVSGGFTTTSARALAAELQSGTLPLRLTLVSRPGLT